MRVWIALVAISLCATVLAEERAETKELTGNLGGRKALLMLYSLQRADGGWRMTGEYVMLPTLARRYLEGERGPELGVTTLKEGMSPILFGHPATAELRGTLRDGVFKGTRYGPGGQERESFEFTEEFPSMGRYTASVSCEAGDARYAAKLAYEVEAGKARSLEWTSRVAPGAHECSVKAMNQEPMSGGVRFASGRCSATLREVGDYVKVEAQGCSAACGSGAYLEPMLVDRRGNCQLLRPEGK
jgi:hypothetical protein